MFDRGRVCIGIFGPLRPCFFSECGPDADAHKAKDEDDATIPM